MKHRALASLGLSALLFGGVAAGGTLLQSGSASASSRASVATADAAAAKARRAMEGGKLSAAIKFAEAAVQAVPDVASYRALLGQAYLQQGRFESARAALADALSLEPGDGRVALNLALAQIATGAWADARKTLDDNADVIPASDHGLAIALAGDPVGAVALLGAAARTPGADAKTRQNLALSLALAGQWREARSVAAFDLSPADVDQRIEQWALFARPQGAADQVSSLLGVTAVQDPGLPVALALSARVPLVAALRPAIEAFMPGQAPNAAEVVAETSASAPPAKVGAAPAITVAISSPEPEPLVFASTKITSNVVFGPRREVVQKIPAAAPKLAVAPARKGPVGRVAIAALAAPVAPLPAAQAMGTKAHVAHAPRAHNMVAAVATVSATAGVAAQPLAKGNFFVQLGAYENAAVARDGWRRITSRVSALEGHSPSGMGFKSAAGSYYRLSVGGFARGDAAALCGKVRASGNTCFVRENAGDKTATWVKPAR